MSEQEVDDEITFNPHNYQEDYDELDPTQQPSPIESMVIDEGDDKGDGESGKVRRSNRTFKRPRKYFEDEILEDEAFIFDGGAIDRMFKQSESGTPITHAHTPEEAAAAPPPLPPIRDPPRSVTVQPKPTKQPKDKSEKSKTTKKSQKQVRHGDEEQAPQPAGKKCFYFDCHKADRSLRVLRPFLVPACKTHSLRVEGRLLEAVASGKMRMHEGGEKDNICGACAGIYGPEILHCGNDSCAFSFCDRCAKTFADKTGNIYNPDSWSCWVCEATREKNRSKERTRYLLGLTTSINPSLQQQPGQPQLPPQQVSPGAKKPAKDKYENMKNPIPSHTSLLPEEEVRSGRGRHAKHKTSKTSYDAEAKLATPKLPPTPIERNESLDAFLESLLASMKFFAQRGGLPPSDEIMSEKLGNLFDIAKQLKLIRAYEDNNDVLWQHVRKLGALIKQHYNLARQVRGGVTPNITAEREYLDVAAEIKQHCTVIMEAIQQCTEGSRENFEKSTRELEASETRASGREETVARQTRALEEEAAQAAVDANAWRAQEQELMEKLNAVRANLARADCKREGLLERINDMKNDLTISRDMLRVIETNVHKAHNKFDGESKSYDLLTQLMNGFNWMIDNFVSKPLLPTDKEANRTSESSAANSPFISKGLGVFYHRSCIGYSALESQAGNLENATSAIREWQSERSGSVHIFSDSPEVDGRYITVVHDAGYIKRLRTRASGKEDAKNDEEGLVSPTAWKASLHAAGVVCEAVDSVTRGGFVRAFCAIQPPGNLVGRAGIPKHLQFQHRHGLLNNIAIGAKYALLTAGYDRIAIVDFDVHQGSGTQDIVQGDEHFLFISIHVFSEQKLPEDPETRKKPTTTTNNTNNNTTSSNTDEAMEDNLSNNICNHTLKTGDGSAAFLRAFTETAIPKMDEFKPQLIFLATSFQGHKNDSSNCLQLTEDDYYTCTKLITDVAKQHASGRVISVMESGFKLEQNSLKKCLNSHLSALMGVGNTSQQTNRNINGNSNNNNMDSRLRVL